MFKLKKYLHHIIIHIVILIQCNNLLAQLPNFTIENYTVEQNLPNNLVQDIDWDNNNILWATTLRGLGRFDGKWIRPFSFQSKDILLGDFNSLLFKQESGQLGFGDIYGRIYGIKNNYPYLADTSFKSKKSIDNTRVLLLPKIYWPNLYRGAATVFSEYDNFSPIVLNNDNILVTHENNLQLYNRQLNKCTTIKKFSTRPVLFCIDGKKFLYETGKGVYIIDVSAEMNVKLLPTQTNWNSLSNEVFWRIGMQYPILIQATNCYLLTFQNNKIQQTLLCNNIPTNISITSIKYNNKIGVLAIATAGNGLYIIKKKVLTSYMVSNSIVLQKSFYFGSQVEIAPNKLMLTYNKSLNLNTGIIQDQNIFTNIKSYAKINDSIVFYSDTSSRIYSYLLKSKTTKQRLIVTKGVSVPSFVTTQGRIFCASSNTISELSTTNDSLFYMLNIKTNQPIINMVEYKPGYILLAGTKGIFGLDVHSKKLDTIYNAGKSWYQSMAVYDDYIFAVNYQTGLLIYKNKKAQVVPPEKFGNFTNLISIYFDRKGFTWLTADNGIIATKTQSLIDNFKDSTKNVGYTFLGKADGMDVAEISGGSQGSSIILKNGNLSYTGINGVVTVDMQAITPPQSSTRLFIDKIVVDNNTTYLKPSDEIKLASNTKKIKFHLINLCWDNIPNTIVEYKLKDDNDNWEVLDYNKQNFIELANIPDGNYTLQVKLSSVYDKSILTQYNLSFSIKPPWYKTIWAYIAISILLILSIWAISTIRYKYLRKRNKILNAKVYKQINEINQQKDLLKEQIVQMEIYQEKLEKDYALKNRLISMIGHDMITPLKFMTNAGNKLINDKHKISPETYDDIVKTIIQTGSNLKDMSTNMLNWIRHHSDNVKFTTEAFYLFDAADLVVKNVMPMASFKNIYIHNKSNSTIQLNQYIEPLKNIIFQILSNAIKYCDDGNIYITSSQTSKNIMLIIKDNGPGITQQQIQHLTNSNRVGTFTSTHENKGHGFGYLIINDMLAIINGTINIESKLGNGTTVYISIPLNVS